MGLGSFIKKAVGVAAPVVGGMVGGPAGAAIGSGISGLISSDQQNAFSAKQAATANQFTKEQLQNRHQWEVADLKAAGLNPILSTGGTPSIGSSAYATNPRSAVQEAATALSSAKQAAIADKTLKNLDAEYDRIRSNANLNRDLSRASQADAKLKSASARVQNNAADISSARAVAGRLAGSGAERVARDYVEPPAKHSYSKFKKIVPLDWFKRDISRSSAKSRSK